jgi:hypothetical protein
MIISIAVLLVVVVTVDERGRTAHALTVTG